MHKKIPKICTGCRVSAAKLYLYHSTKIVKAGPGLDDWPEHPSVQINSSSPWLNAHFRVTKLLHSFHIKFQINCQFLFFKLNELKMNSLQNLKKI